MKREKYYCKLKINKELLTQLVHYIDSVFKPYDTLIIREFYDLRNNKQKIT